MKDNVIHRLIFFTAAFALLFHAPSLAFGQGSPDVRWIAHGNQDRINNLIFNPAGDTVISGSSDRLINFWRVSDGKLLRTFNASAPFVHESAIEWLNMTGDGARLASCSYEIVQLWNVAQGTDRKLLGHTDWVVGVSFSPNGQLLASASFDKTVRIWRVSDGVSIKTLTNTRQMRSVAFSPDGSLLAGAGGDNEVHLWRTSDWTEARSLKGHSLDIYVIAFSPDGTKIASGGYDQTVKVWDVASGQLLYTLDGNRGNVYGIAFAPDSSRLAYTDGEGKTVRIHRASDGALLRLYDQQVDEVQCLAFSPQGLLAYGIVDERVFLASVEGSTTNPPPAQGWTLTAAAKGGGAIQVAPAPNGPNGTYLNNTIVQLTAVASSGQFAGWNGAVSSSASTVSITMESHKSIVAEFPLTTASQLVWQNGRGVLASWYLDGSAYLCSGLLNSSTIPGLSWKPCGSGDFNNDGQKDFLFQHTDGRLSLWLMNGANRTSAVLLRDGAKVAPGWRAIDVGDLDGDGKIDILFGHDNGLLAAWLMNGTGYRAGVSLNDAKPVGATWRAIALADFNGDGHSDILWQSTSSAAAIWLMNRTDRASSVSVRNGASAGAGWRLIDAGDFNKDRKQDVLWQSEGGQLHAWTLLNGQYQGTTQVRSGAAAPPGWTAVTMR